MTWAGEPRFGKQVRITLLRVIPTMTFIRFVTDKSSGILSGISSGILSGILPGISSGILSGILPGISSGILPGISSGILSDMLSSILSVAYLLAFMKPKHALKIHAICRAWSSRTQHPKRDFTWMKLAVVNHGPTQGSQMRLTSTSRHQAPPRRGVNHNHPQANTLPDIHLHLKAPGTTMPGG